MGFTISNCDSTKKGDGKYAKIKNQTMYSKTQNVQRQKNRMVKKNNYLPSKVVKTCFNMILKQRKNVFRYFLAPKNRPKILIFPVWDQKLKFFEDKKKNRGHLDKKST